ncbi:MAG: putative selenium-dependent hydroxylase accessory protein YqeC [Fusobacteriaceae bacterium]|nr:putative selenium-dependent hydroxylase accessory protein YqeC [Fusobacteriaceae bacterium]
MSKKNSFYEAFNIKLGDVISVTGGGGKTSLIFKLADELSKIGRVLITTSTKIYTPLNEQYERLILCSGDYSSVAVSYKGQNKNIDILGSTIDMVSNKLIGVSDDVLCQYLDKYDFILNEADGSARKPLKSWNEFEPVISKYTKKIIGVTNLDSIGKTIESVVHRKEIFCKKIDKNENEIIDLNLLKTYLLNADFFKNSLSDEFNSRVEKFIFINGVETLEKVNSCLYLGNSFLNAENSKSIQDIKINFGSIMKQEIFIYKKISAIGLFSGLSKRMGKDKLLIQYKGKSLIMHIIEKLNKINFYEKLFVSTPSKIELLKGYLTDNWILVENIEPEIGQSQSIKLGIESLNNNFIESYMFFTGDQPFLTEETILELIKESLKPENIYKVMIPYIGKSSFSPVIFPSKYKDNLLSIKGDKGGKSVIKDDSEIEKIYFETQRDFIDIDTEEDLKYLEEC